MFNSKQTTQDYFLVQHFFERYAKRKPNALVARKGSTTLTYGELNHHANQLANCLIMLGIRLEQTIGICLGRCLENLVALLGVSKAGAAYIPFDPQYSILRLQNMLRLAKTEIVITNSELQHQFRHLGIQVICLDNDYSEIQSYSSKTPRIKLQPHNLACCIFTSGSTGIPKAVAIEHRGLVNLLQWYQQTYSANAKDRCSVLTGPGFDAANMEIWPPLSCGASLHFPEENIHLSPQKLIAWLVEQKISISCLPTAIVELVLQEAWPPQSNLRLVFTGGDRLRYSPNKLIPFSLSYLYGPTEDTVTTTHYFVPKVEIGKETVAPSIGQAIKNHKVYVLDENLCEVSPGEIGELHISGVGLARGYLHQPELTTERFIANPFATPLHERLYKTGDLVRYRSDGLLEFISRNDNQVKIRGMRIELGEIEAHLQKHLNIKQAFVIAKETNNGDKYLLAYYLLRDDTKKIIATELHALLQKALPNYMIPRYFIEVAAFPFTPNGKLDHKLLPLPSNNSLLASERKAFSATEKFLLNLWTELLGIDVIRLDADFFALGGHSLLVAKLIQKIAQKFNVTLPLTCFMTKPTITSLAQFLDRAKPDNGSDFIQELLADAKLQFPGPPLRGLVRATNYITKLWRRIVARAEERKRRPASFCKSTKIAARDSKIKAILLTGSCGFLGTHLLQELLVKTSAQIYCLVRAKDHAAATLRLQESFTKYGCSLEQLDTRVIPIIGDLAQPQLGNPVIFNHLAETIDCIFHNGAMVNAIASYATLKASNVQGTLNIIQLAMTKKIKTINFVSTLDAVYQADSNGIHLELLPMISPPNLANGYGLTKWVSERLLVQAQEQGVPVRIFRSGRILGHSTLGISPSNDALLIFIKGCIQFGYAPDLNLYLGILPVDFVSRALVQISLLPEAYSKQLDFRLGVKERASGVYVVVHEDASDENNNAEKLVPRGDSSAKSIYHLYNSKGVTWRQLVAWLNNYGFDLKLISLPCWQEKLGSLANDHVLYALLPILLQPTINLDISGESSRIATHNTDQICRIYELECPAITNDLLKIYFDYLIK